MTRWQWLIYSLVQVLIIVGLLALAAVLGFTMWGALALLSAVLFTWRSFNHPDLWLRRLSLFFASIGTTYLFSKQIINLLPSDLPEWFSSLVSILSVFLPDHFWGSAICLSLSVVFAGLELVRDGRARSGGLSGDDPTIQTTSVAEKLLDKENKITLTFEATVTNPSQSSAVFTKPLVTRLVIWPQTKRAKIYSRKNATLVSEGDKITIQAGAAVDLKIEAVFNPKFRIPNVFQENAAYRLLFSHRRITLKTRTTSGRNMMIADTDRLAA